MGANVLSIAELEELHAFACQVARRAGKYLREDQIRRQTTELTSEEKLNSVDLVTAADQNVEKLIR